MNNEIEKQEVTSDKIIKRHVYWAVGAGLIPIPIGDIVAVTAIQLDMLKHLCDHYEVDYASEKGKSWISAIVSTTMASFAARTGASLIKVVPAVGTIIGMSAMAVLSGASTYAIGKVFSKHFEDGGTLDNVNTSKLKELYKQKVNEGKAIAKDLKKKILSQRKNKDVKGKEQNATQKLQELEKLKKQELISEEEYNDMRMAVLKELMGD